MVSGDVSVSPLQIESQGWGYSCPDGDGLPPCHRAPHARLWFPHHGGHGSAGSVPSPEALVPGPASERMRAAVGGMRRVAPKRPSGLTL